MRTKQFLLGFILVALFLPLANNNFPFIWTHGLKGAVTAAANPDFSWKAWWQGSYQADKEKYWETNFGFYPDMIRLNNELDYKLFGIFHANGVVKGPNNVLFEKVYVESYTGEKSHDDSYILGASLDIKRMQDRVEAMNKPFVFVIAPNKAFYYNDELPSGHSIQNIKNRNYERFLKVFDSLNIKYIDFNRYFFERKTKTTFPLITKLGVHWSSYGTAVAADSILKYLNTHYFKNKLTTYDIECQPSKIHNAHDKEILEALNMITDFENNGEITCWPALKHKAPADPIKPKLLFVSDSYFWEIYSQKIIESVCSDLQFWYYVREHWAKNDTFIGDMATNTTLGDEYLLQTDAVILMASEFHLDCLSPFLNKLPKINQ